MVFISSSACRLSEEQSPALVHGSVNDVQGSRVAVVVFLLWLSSCGGYAPAPQKESGSLVDFTYKIDAQTYRLADLRGRPIVLVLMRISEMPSHIYLKEVVRAFHKAAGKTRFLVLTIEPSEEAFIELFVESEELPFPIGVAEEDVAHGKSALGRIPVVPTTYFVDSSGSVVSVAVGGVEEKKIVKAINTLVDR